MSVSVVVPFRRDGAERDRNWAWLESRYRTLYPDWELVVGHDKSEGPWCKGKILNAAVEQASGDLLVISDADMFLSDEVMREAVSRLEDSVWVVPHRRSYRLTEPATAQFIAGTLGQAELTHDHLEMPPRWMYPCGGLFFIWKSAYLAAGGIDERFTGWGSEDEAFGYALATLCGSPVLLEKVLIHLYHRPQVDMPVDRRRPAHTGPLIDRYEAAQGKPDVMRALVDEDRAASDEKIVTPALP